MEELRCFSCKAGLGSATAVLKDDIWTVPCPSCAVINRLQPHPDRDGGLVVTGAFFISHMRDVVAPRPPADRRKSAAGAKSARASSDIKLR